MRPAWLALMVAAVCTACSEPPPAVLRVATFNASLNRYDAGDLIADLAGGVDSQAAKVAEIVQRVRPDIVLLNEFDHDEGGEAVRLFHDRYLAVGQNASGAGAAEPIMYSYWYSATVNTGVPSGHDLDHNGVVGESGMAYGGDAWGFGFFPGQFGMVVYSRYPIDLDRVRTFQNFRWRDLPGAQLPVDPASGEPWYSAAVLDVFPLSSKSHWDLPVLVGDTVLHLLASHPSPPVFDGPEDRNGRRNHDEIQFWVEYLTPGRGMELYDDTGAYGGLPEEALFIVLGDLNADPNDGDGDPASIRRLLAHERLAAAPVPSSVGGAEQAVLQGGVNEGQLGDPSNDTGDFGDDPPGPGNLRLDYVLPSAGLRVVGAGVFWPPSDDHLAGLVTASDHRLVWLDVTIPEPAPER